MTDAYPTMDSEWEEDLIVDVQPCSGGWSIERANGWSFFVPSEHGVEPRVGDLARFYPGRIGAAVRGLYLNGVCVFYRSAVAEAALRYQRQQESEQRQREEFERRRPEYDGAYNLLSSAFQARIDRFRSSGTDWRWKFEAYEILVCREAQQMAYRFPTEEKLRAFAATPEAEQRAAAPELAYDQHSGNSWDAAIQLALITLREPALVLLAHGALCPLVGCQEYGCSAERKPS